MLFLISLHGGSDVMDKYGTIYSNLQRITEEGCPMFSPDTSLGYNAKVVNNLEYVKHDWILKFSYKTTFIVTDFGI